MSEAEEPSVESSTMPTAGRTLASGAGYNERLFGKAGLRSFYHLARFSWAERQVREHCGTHLSVVELGCFDARLFDHLRPYVSDYVGIDANWESGLDLARQKHAGSSNVRLIEAADPAVFDQFPDDSFDVAASLETLEHLPPDLLPSFLDQLARVTKGQLLVTVPNELGPVFLLKHALKLVHYGDAENYALREAVAATLRQSHKIERKEHKGFDYRELVREIGKRFDIKAIEGLPRLGLPPSLSPTVAIRALSK